MTQRESELRTLCYTIRASSIISKAPQKKEYIQAVLEAFEVDMDLLKTKSKKHLRAEARFFIYKYLKDNTKLTLEEIGNLFNRTHASVLNGLKRYQNYIDSNDTKVITSQQRIDEIFTKLTFLKSISKT